MAQHGLPGRRVFRCSTAPTNPKGVAVRGKGYITYADSVSGQVVRWDLRGDEFEHIIGKEYLSAFHNVMRVGTIFGGQDRIPRRQHDGGDWNYRVAIPA